MIRAARGVSLIEIVIVTFILGVVIAVVYSILAASQKAVDEGTKMSEIEQRARVAVDTLKDELLYAKLDYADTGILPRGKYLKYRISNKAGDLQFGYLDRSGVFQQGWYTVVTFVPEKYFREPSASSSPSPFEQSRVPLNRNAAHNDVLACGRLVRRVFNSGGGLDREIVLCSDLILDQANLDAGDVDGDGTIDPVFELQD
jgi:prepilin-type N-terminal cleavage/methylation domain-containing protein